MIRRFYLPSAALVASIALTTGCDGPTIPSHPPEPEVLSVTSETTGTALAVSPTDDLVHFLPPLSRGEISGGPFDVTLEAVVEICRVGPTGDCLLPPVAVLTGDSPGPSRVRVDAGAAQYVAVWKPDRSAARGLHRVRVLAQGLFLDEAEVRLAEPGRGSGGRGGELPTLQAGSAVPIRFHIVAGAIEMANTPPEVTVTAPDDGFVVPEGEEVVFTATATDVPDGDLSSVVAWSSELDGPLGTGATVAATLTPGSHRVSATVTDTHGAVGGATVTVVVDRRPTSVLQAPASAWFRRGGTAFVLDGRESTDVDGVIVRWVWTKVSGVGGALTVGTPVETTVPTLTVESPYDTPLALGEHVYRLEVMDDSGNRSAPDEAAVAVLNADPTIEPTSGRFNTPFTIFDPQGRMQDGDRACFYAYGSNPDAASYALDVSLSADGTTLTGTVPSVTDGMLYQVRVGEGLACGFERFPELEFYVEL